MAFILQWFDAPSVSTAAAAASHLGADGPPVARAKVVRAEHENRCNGSHGWRSFGDPKPAGLGAVDQGLRRRPLGR